MSILSAETESLIQQEAVKTGRTPDEVVRLALRIAAAAQLGVQIRPAPNLSKDELLKRMKEISDRSASRPVLDNRTPDEIIGYDDFGVPS
jgi:antitoxin VapB